MRSLLHQTIVSLGIVVWILLFIVGGAIFDLNLWKSARWTGDDTNTELDHTLWYTLSYNVHAYLTLSTNHLSTNFTTKEASHLADLRLLVQLFGLLYWILFISLGYVFCSRQYRFIQGLQLAGIILIGIVIILSVVPFNISFRLVHYILFPQGNWQFTKESLLIQLYPLEFFVTMAMHISYRILIAGSLLLIISTIFLKLGVIPKLGRNKV
ncbi:MAG: DUF1461 domain-containing protein [Nanoarchaeota archaeon]